MSGKPALWPAGGPWTAAVMVWLVALSVPVAKGGDSLVIFEEKIFSKEETVGLISKTLSGLKTKGLWFGERFSWAAGLSLRKVPGPGQQPRPDGRLHTGDFVYQIKFLCYFTNGTQRVRLMESYIYNLEEYVRLDSDVGEFRALTALGPPDAKYWNGQKDILEEHRAYVDTVCRHNYQIEARTTFQRRVEPTVTISPCEGVYTPMCSTPVSNPITVEWHKGQFVSVDPGDEWQSFGALLEVLTYTPLTPCLL
ncbi:PREDICTED: uncharacterized protein LOC102761265 [Myotis davidii]|uniref:uncharacterized protein LOC102761265 n=1 Tax=Myotis davidii TaxID=225400 RepID=UPI00076703AA|nr:PREDICTED: uncharacterized protein LOC102761265 [Myotis davidii]